MSGLGSKPLLDRIAANGVRTILVESPDSLPAISPCSSPAAISCSALI